MPNLYIIDGWPFFLFSDLILAQGHMTSASCVLNSQCRGAIELFVHIMAFPIGIRQRELLERSTVGVWLASDIMINVCMRRKLDMPHYGRKFNNDACGQLRAVPVSHHPTLFSHFHRPSVPLSIAPWPTVRLSIAPWSLCLCGPFSIAQPPNSPSLPRLNWDRSACSVAASYRPPMLATRA
jgi:hypothetical protein